MSVTGSFNIAEVSLLIKNATQEGLYLAGEHLLNASNEHVPHEAGDLQGSGVVSEGDMEVAVSYDTVYAARQHEELGWRHDEGRTAKFLENAMNSEAAVMARIIADEARGQIGN